MYFANPTKTLPVRIFLHTITIAAATLCLSFTVDAQEKSNQSIEAQFISNVRQLTFEGLRAGEGYYNSDGTLMTFQSERRPDNPFFQIYLLNLQTGDIEPVSPGHGKTTCSWIHPNNNLVLFSSTHDDPEARAKQKAEIEFRESGQSRRYAWDYDSTFEIYAYDRKEKSYARLTNAEGYDAEGSYSPDGKLIAFASNRAGFSKELTDEVRKKFEIDLSYLMDIYIMNADGSDVRQLTNNLGYDGGPFFSADGQKICWRRFSEDGKTAEIFTMNLDGSNQQQLTRLGALSWAPYFHPSGKYLIFTTNRHGFANFELYLVPADGKSLPVRVTDTDGFDGLASFTPDGKKLTWTSGRTAKKDSQIFVADWNHESAIQALINAGVSQPNSALGAASAEDGGIAETTNERVVQTATAIDDQETAKQAKKTAAASRGAIDPNDFQLHIDYFKSATFNGHEADSDSETKMTAYIASYFAALGLEPGGDDGGWFQSFQFPIDYELGANNRFTELLVGEEAAEIGLKQDWQPLMIGQQNSISNLSVAFAGFGIVAPSQGNELAYDSFDSLDVNGRWVVVMDGVPHKVSDERKRYLEFYGDLSKRAYYAEQRGAQGLIVVGLPQDGDNQIAKRADFALKSNRIPVIAVSTSVMDGWLSTNNQDLEQLHANIDSGDAVTGFEISDLRLSLELDVKPVMATGRNVIARLPASESPSSTAILIGANLNRIDPAFKDEANRIDTRVDCQNAIAGVLEIAQFMSSQKQEGKLALKRDVVFAVWSASSGGEQGASHFVDSRVKTISTSSKPKSESGHQFVVGIDSTGSYSINGKPASREDLDRSFAYLGKNHPDFEVIVDCDSDTQMREIEGLKSVASSHGVTKFMFREIRNDSTTSLVVAAIDLQSLGGSEQPLELQGTGSSSNWAGAIESRNVVVGLPISIHAEMNFPTDASPFLKAEIPAISAFVKPRANSKTESESSDKANYQVAASSAQLLALVARGMVTSDEEIDFIAPESKIRIRSRSGARASLGTMPDYSADVIGAKLSDVRAGSPAQKAGLRASDVIIELAGKEIESVEEYSAVLNELKVGEETEIVIERDGERLTLKITPAARQ